jgi:hypothetical protein
MPPTLWNVEIRRFAFWPGFGDRPTRPQKLPT